MKSNPYVYPTVPFKKLANKNILDNFTAGKELSFKALKEEVAKIKQPKVSPKGKSVEEKILNLFLDSKVIFGPKEFISRDKKNWEEKFAYFVQKNKPLQFTILGFPFKMPVALKTSRKMPDMGEVLALSRLKSIVDNIKKIYDPGAVIHIFTEGGFGPFNGVAKNTWVDYDKFLRKIIKNLAWNKEFRVRMLSEMEGDANFKKNFKLRILENKKLLADKDTDFMKKYTGTVSPLFKIVTSKKYAEDLLMDVYNENLPDDEVSQGVIAARNDMRKRTDNCIVHYFAYLKTRDDLDFLNKTIPHYLALSVSPKPGRLGVTPINEKCRLLPYHGVPVYSTKNKTWTIEYLIDIRRDGVKYEKVFLTEDVENEPFFYIRKG
ncbi:MAG: L-tyrosine/L-tryptophan isonitrile synthase family protein [Candidatus Moraniibacteriota bacterium]|jgi:pyoverdine/dityrosine biosynthesis protein Dit1